MTATLATEDEPTKRPCASCGAEVEHVVTRYFRKSRSGALEQGTTFTPKSHHRADGKPCAGSRP